jgi:hypothetical protein
MICLRKECWLALAEILVIFAMFALQGAWPAPDVNEAHYLGKAAHYWNPDWVRGDFFLDTADSHKVFYFAFGWLTLLLPLPAVAWTGRIITWLLLAWSWRRLSVAVLSPSATAGWSSSASGVGSTGSLLDKPAVAPAPRARFGWAIFTAGLFLVLNERLQMAGEWFIGGVEAKGFAYVLMLLGLESLLKSKWNRAWLLFGASAGFHVLVGGWAVIAAGLAWIFMRTDRPRLVSMLPGLAGGFLLSLPGLIPSLMLSRGIDAETARTANVIYVFERLRHHLDVFQIKMDFVWRFAALTLGFLFLCRVINRFIDRKSIPEQADVSVVARFRSIRLLQCFVAGSLAIALIGVMIDLVGPYDRTLAAGLLRFYWFRTADIIVPLGTALLAAFWIKEQLTVKSVGGILALAVAIVAIGWHLETYIPLRMHPVPARGDINMINAMLMPQPDQPSPSKAARLKNLSAWKDVCLWIRENTPTDARFFTPRLSQTFKWYARRAEVATWKDVPQDAASLVAWWDQIEDLFCTGSPQPEFRWRENVMDMEPTQLAALAEKYKADYIVAPPVSALRGWKIIYETKRGKTDAKGYAVYQIDRGAGP